MKSYKIENLSALPAVVDQFLLDWDLERFSLISFDAPMGVGKTTFIKALVEKLGVQDMVNSPTFSIVNEYYSPSLDRAIYHFDCYRLSSLEDALNIGFEDYVSGGGLCLVEWPEVVAPLIPDDSLEVKLREIEDGARVLEAEMVNR